MSKCECEHISHFNGKGHEYALVTQSLTTIITNYGRFEICAACSSANHIKEMK